MNLSKGSPAASVVKGLPTCIRDDTGDRSYMRDQVNRGIDAALRADLSKQRLVKLTNGRVVIHPSRNAAIPTGPVIGALHATTSRRSSRARATVDAYRASSPKQRIATA